MICEARRVRSLATFAALAACGSRPSVATDATDAVGSSDAPLVADARACGTRIGMRGLTSRMVRAGDLDRTYLVYLPVEDDPSQPTPLVFVHHGWTMSGQEMVDLTGYTLLADSEHVALAFPDGQAGPHSTGAPWNVGTDVCPASASIPPPVATGDDFAFLDAMKADIAQDQCLDVAHVYVTGFSMGGYFSHHAGCMRDDVRAIAPHSGGTHALGQCPVSHKPVIIFHGLADPLIPDGCDDPGQQAPTGFTASATEWAHKNGCATTMHTVAVENGTCAVYDGCPADGQVELCTFTLMGHCWAGGAASLFGCSAYASATQLEWRFFKQYAW
jgi:polyhydroxybutyrate depolymerase